MRQFKDGSDFVRLDNQTLTGKVVHHKSGPTDKLLHQIATAGHLSGQGVILQTERCWIQAPAMSGSYCEYELLTSFPTPRSQTCRIHLTI